MGKPEFTKVTEISANPFKRVRYVNATFTDVIGVGVTHVVNVYAPAGYMSKILAMTLLYPPISGATTGTKNVFIFTAERTIGTFNSVANFGNNNHFTMMHWVPTGSANDVLIEPAAPQSPAMSSLVFDEDSGISFNFKNSTDVDDGGVEKKVQLWILDEKISG